MLELESVPGEGTTVTMEKWLAGHPADSNPSASEKGSTP
jgi:hypothetical protein